MTGKRGKSTAAQAGLASGMGVAHDPGTIAASGPAAHYLADLQDKVERRMAKARAAKSAGKAQHISRASQLRDEGVLAPMIGIRMGHEEGKDKPYPERTVRRWLSGVDRGKG